MFLQNYMYQSLCVLELAYTDAQKLQHPKKKGRSLSRKALHYGNLEFKALARRYLHFSMPCMAAEMWRIGLKTEAPSYDMIRKKCSSLTNLLVEVCYTDRSVQSEAVYDIIEDSYNEKDLTLEQVQKLKLLLGAESIKIPFCNNIPYFDDGHGYTFFYDNTPYDASCSLLLSQAEAEAKDDPERAIPLPCLDQVFGHDDWFVIDQFSQMPNKCLGPTNDASVLKKIKLMMGPDYVQDVAMTNIKELKHLGLWKPSELEVLMMTGKLSVKSAVKTLFGSQVTAPMYLYWEWVEKSSRDDAPINTKQWVRKELSDRITSGEIYNIRLDQCTLDWLTEEGIAKTLNYSAEDYYIIPNFDRNRFASRAASEQRMTLKEWAWSPQHAHMFKKFMGTKLEGLPHDKYIPSSDFTTIPADAPADEPNYDEFTQEELDAIFVEVQEFNDWAKAEEADTSDIIESVELTPEEEAKTSRVFSIRSTDGMAGVATAESCSDSTDGPSEQDGSAVAKTDTPAQRIDGATMSLNFGSTSVVREESSEIHKSEDNSTIKMSLDFGGGTSSDIVHERKEDEVEKSAVDDGNDVGKMSLNFQ